MVFAALACSGIGDLPLDALRATDVPPTQAPVAATPTAAVPPSQGWIAFVNQNNLWLIHPDGTSPRQITSNPFPPENKWGRNSDMRVDWAPDGAKLAFSKGPRLYLVDIATLRTTPLVERTSGGFGWSRTSDQIMYGTPELPSDRFSDDGLWAVHLEDNSTQRITPDLAGFWNPQWSPDGGHVLFANPGIDPNGSSVMSMTAQQPVDLPVNARGGIGAGDCAWSPDLTIACITIAEELPFEPVLKLIDKDGSLIREVPLPEEIGVSESALRWSPDGKRLAITYLVRPPDVVAVEARIDILILATEAFSTLSTGYASAWSPDGNWIVAYDLAWDADQLPRAMTVIHAVSGEAHPISEGFYPVWQPPSAVVPPAATQQAQAAASTGTPLSSGSICTSADITLVDTPKGNFLQMCADGEQVEVGPLENGGHGMAPNGQFFVYCANSGGCYAARVGDIRLTPIGSVKSFSIIRRGEAPKYSFSWHGSHPYTVQISEDVMNQNETFAIPAHISAEK
jgi:dipeptidyl aminopeptidase/acylaminoacyl peptidase